MYRSYEFFCFCFHYIIHYILVVALFSLRVFDLSGGLTYRSPESVFGRWFRLEVDPLLSVFGAVVSSFYIGIVANSASLLSVYKHPYPNNERSLHIDPSILFASSVWLEGLAFCIVSLVLFVGGFSAGCAYVVVRLPSRTEDLAFLTRTKFLHGKTTASRYWWLLVAIARGIVLTSLNVLSVINRGLALSAMVSVHMMYLASVVRWCPWRFPVANHVEAAVLLVVVGNGTTIYSSSEQTNSFVGTMILVAVVMLTLSWAVTPSMKPTNNIIPSLKSFDTSTERMAWTTKQLCLADSQQILLFLKLSQKINVKRDP